MFFSYLLLNDINSCCTISRRPEPKGLITVRIRTKELWIKPCDNDLLKQWHPIKLLCFWLLCPSVINERKRSRESSCKRGNKPFIAQEASNWKWNTRLMDLLLHSMLPIKRPNVRFLKSEAASIRKLKHILVRWIKNFVGFQFFFVSMLSCGCFRY